MKNDCSAPARAKFVKFGHKLLVNNDQRNGSLLLQTGFIFIPARARLSPRSFSLIDNFSNTCKEGVQIQGKPYQGFFPVFALIELALPGQDCNDRNQRYNYNSPPAPVQRPWQHSGTRPRPSRLEFVSL